MDQGSRGASPETERVVRAVSSGWTVDALAETDLTEVLEIEAQSFTNPWTRAMFEGELLNPGVARGYVLRTPEWRVAAFCTVFVMADELHVNNLAVRPECRGMGAGRALLEFVIGDAVSLGARRATLEVRQSNSIALKLYERLGFSVAAIRKDYYANPVEDALILWKDGLAATGSTSGEGAA
jgi:[ribosomal protein S18]-alanine N-acetyltransferase